MRSAALAGLALLAGCNPAPRGDEGPSGKETQAPIEVVTATPGAEGDAAVAAKVPVKVPAKALPAPATVPLPANLQALGTEPFWSIAISGAKLRYSSPENPKGTTFSAKVEPRGKAIRYSGVLDGKPVVLLIEPGECSDGMSDTEYPLAAAFTWGERTEQGCARPK